MTTKFDGDGTFIVSRVPVAWWKRTIHRLTRGRFGDDGYRFPPPGAVYVEMYGGGGGGRDGVVPVEPERTRIEIKPSETITVTIGESK